MSDVSREETDRAEIREEEHKPCARFPGNDGRKPDAERGHATAFVSAVTEGGYLSVPMPEEHGGSGLEDTFHVESGRKAAGHGDLVDKARWIVERLGGEIALSDGARRLLRRSQ